MAERGRCLTVGTLTALAFGVAVAYSAPALADSAAPVEPISPPSSIGTALGQNGAEAVGPLGIPDLAGYAPGLLLGQNAVPSAPGEPTTVTAPDLRAFAGQYLLPQNVEPAAPGRGVADVGMGPSPADPSTGRLAFLRRLHEMYQGGDLTGALLGQVPDEQLGQPLPGTAPGPGTYLPPGLGHTPPQPPR
ncbi:hypothetical protein ORI20_14735 [Mycobacterium sp. CVI_P3]|uniref:Uncharacterized protein n=1 Tax=Mycobacterium pinniadriaticum TaxID=2994102 RepID=A0ABT3SEY1_9MYCO|nr:hypothetical protein [Mycobacterium pinniadriaticum]MCX2931534.1 hypothetical protein [Mycobacterium pinniadriaticum]MCX2938074.1 hypothetical protein [Mycobacterium pinniadriaticum]